VSVVPTVSVVIPAYNNVRTLDETIRSVLEQQDVDYEVLISDHSSSDDTLALAERFARDPRVRVATTPAGGGAERNWNAVTQRASGKYLKLVCGDDVLLPGVLARQARLLESTGAALTACRRDIVDIHGRVLKHGWGLRGLRGCVTGGEAVRRAVRAGSNLFGEPASVMMQRELIERQGGWDGRFPYLIDQCTYSRVLLEGDFIADDATGATFRMSAAQWSVALVREQSSQARDFHHWIAARADGLISRGDLILGDARAAAMARARRLSYAVLKRRMR